MGKSNSRSSKSNGGKSNASRNNSGRPKPMPYKSGVTKNRTRYGNGGEYCW